MGSPQLETFKCPVAQDLLDMFISVRLDCQSKTFEISTNPIVRLENAGLRDYPGEDQPVENLRLSDHDRTCLRPGPPLRIERECLAQIEHLLADFGQHDRIGAVE
jgi:hypothetical protein